MHDIAEALTLALTLVLSGDADLVEIVLLSLYVSVAATLLACLIGIPLGAALAIGRRSGAAGASSFAAFLALTLLLAAAAVSLGLLISALVERASVATGIALFLSLIHI